MLQPACHIWRKRFDWSFGFLKMTFECKAKLSGSKACSVEQRRMWWEGSASWSFREGRTGLWLWSQCARALCSWSVHLEILISEKLEDITQGTQAKMAAQTTKES
jgi:hypothetical protein